MSCEHCNNRDLPPEGEAAAHDFLIARDNIDAEIFYYDSVRGWEGEKINYCPWCGEMINASYKHGDIVTTPDGQRLECAGPGPVTIMGDEDLNLLMSREAILEAAKKCVCSDRNRQYGDPEDNFNTIAKLWSVYLAATGLSDGQDDWRLITPEDVAVMMNLLKVARIATGTQKADSWIDAIGYMACGGEIASRK